LFEEAVSLDKEFKYSEVLDNKAEEIRRLQSAWLDTKDGSKAHQFYLMIAQALRVLRKSLAGHCFDVRKMASIKRIASTYMKTATKTQAEKEDEAVEKLIRKAPKKKPPRKDLRKNRVEISEDPDLQGVGRGDQGDPDLSRRSQKMSKIVAYKYLNLRG
jgi:hypothetical protein